MEFATDRARRSSIASAFGAPADIDEDEPAVEAPVTTPAGRLPSALESAIAEAFGAAVSTIQLDAITLSLAASTKSSRRPSGAERALRAACGAALKASAAELEGSAYTALLDAGSPPRPSDATPPPDGSPPAPPPDGSPSGSTASAPALQSVMQSVGVSRAEIASLVARMERERVSTLEVPHLLQGLTASATRMPVENAVLRAFGAAMQHARAAQYIAAGAAAAARSPPPALSPAVWSPTEAAAQRRGRRASFCTATSRLEPLRSGARRASVADLSDARGRAETRDAPAVAGGLQGHPMRQRSRSLSPPRSARVTQRHVSETMAAFGVTRGELESLRQQMEADELETLPVPVAEAVPSLLNGMARHAASRKTLEPVEAAVLRAFLGADAL